MHLEPEKSAEEQFRIRQYRVDNCPVDTGYIPVEVLFTPDQRNMSIESLANSFLGWSWHVRVLSTCVHPGLAKTHGTIFRSRMLIPASASLAITLSVKSDLNIINHWTSCVSCSARGTDQPHMLIRVLHFSKQSEQQIRHLSRSHCPSLSCRHGPLVLLESFSRQSSHRA